MKSVLHFVKMEALGNDFVLIDALHKEGESTYDWSKLSTVLCDRRRGVGADQVLVIKPSKDDRAMADMYIWNVDGSRAEACGNGLRCVALYLFLRRGAAENFYINTPSGNRFASIEGDKIAVGMGVVKESPSSIPLAEGIDATELVFDFKDRLFKGRAVSVGNPHCVFVGEDDILSAARKYGPVIEKDARFPNGVNVEFVKVLSRGAVEMAVWERGAGLTPACGSGACAAAYVAVKEGMTDFPVQVHMPGGTVEVLSVDGELMLKGPARICFEGDYFL